MKLKATINYPYNTYRYRKMISGKRYCGYGSTPDKAIQNFMEKYKALNRIKFLKIFEWKCYIF